MLCINQPTAENLTFPQLTRVPTPFTAYFQPQALVHKSAMCCDGNINITCFATEVYHQVYIPDVFHIGL